MKRNHCFFLELSKNTRGYSLVSIMVAIPIAAIVLSFFLTIAGGLIDRYQDSKARGEVTQIQDYLRRNFYSASQCVSRLHSSTDKFDANKAIIGGGLDLAFVLDDNTSVLRTGQDLISYGLHINSFKFKMQNSGLNFQDDPALLQNKLQFGLLVMNSNNISFSSKTPPKDKVITPLVLSVNPVTGDIDRCFLADSEFDLCGQIGGTKITLPNGSTTCKIFPSCGNLLMTGIDADGHAVCKTLPTMVDEYCPPNHTLVSNGSGDSICRNIGLTLQAALTNPPASTGTPVPTSGTGNNACSGSELDGISTGSGGYGVFTFYTCSGGLIGTFTYTGGSFSFEPGIDAGKVPCSIGPMPDGNMGVRCADAWISMPAPP